MKINPRALGLRIIVGIGVPLACIVGAVCLYALQQGPPCMFYQLTKIHCPGCGSCRATLALLRGDVLSAVDYNVFYVIFLPIIAYYILKVYIVYVFGCDVLPFFKVKLWLAVMIFVFIVAFWILRNIPIYPFTYLAP